MDLGKISLAPTIKSDHYQSDPLTNTLNEPVQATIVTSTQMRDVNRVLLKMKTVLFPKISSEEKYKEIRDWDLWGPLFICLFLAVVLSFMANSGDQSSVFGMIFLIVWVGGAIVSVNSQLLGGQLSLCQSVCVLGYCIFPLVISALVVGLLFFVPLLLKITFVFGGFIWSLFSSMGFLTALVPEDKKLLVEYPVLLFFFFLSWFILVV